MNLLIHSFNEGFNYDPGTLSFSTYPHLKNAFGLHSNYVGTSLPQYHEAKMQMSQQLCKIQMKEELQMVWFKLE